MDMRFGQFRNMQTCLKPKLLNIAQDKRNKYLNYIKILLITY